MSLNGMNLLRLGAAFGTGAALGINYPKVKNVNDPDLIEVKGTYSSDIMPCQGLPSDQPITTTFRSRGASPED